MSLATVLTNLAHAAAARRAGYRPTASKFSVQTPHCARASAMEGKLGIRSTPQAHVSFVDMLPCPHCQGTRLELIDTNVPLVQVLCLNCGTMGPEETKWALAIHAWNSLPRLQSAIENRQS